MGDKSNEPERNKRVSEIALIRPELVEIPEDGSQPYLKGSKCTKCGQLDFPAPSICPICWNDQFEAIPLSQKGKIYSFTEVFLGQPSFSYPMIIGYVDLPEDIRVFSQFEGNLDDLKCDEIVEVTVGVIATDEDGNTVSSYKFKKPAI